MSRNVIIGGVGMTRFRRPSEGAIYDELGAEAAKAALSDAGLNFADVQQVYAGWAYGDTTSGQRALASLGLTGVPFFNTNNACASGSSAAYLARQAVASGAADCVLAVGFEQMPRGAIGANFKDRPNVWDKHVEIADSWTGESDLPVALRCFAAAGREHMERDGITAADYAKVAVKAREHAAKNPNAVFRDLVTVEEVLASTAYMDPITKLQCCPPTSGGAAAVICSEDFARQNGIDATVRIAGMAMVSDTPAQFHDSAIDMVGAAITRQAVAQAYDAAGIGAEDVDVVELHDCFTINEALSYESLGLTPPGTAARFINDNQATYGGQVVVNPSGGLLSKGHPLGATGLAQLAELTWQLRGHAEARQVKGARIGLQHNVGLNGAAVVSVLEAAF